MIGVVIDVCVFFFFFKQKTAYEMRISDWSSDVCSSDLLARVARDLEAEVGRVARDVPGAQAAFAVQPLLQLGLDPGHGDVAGQPVAQEALEQIGRASCRERVCQYV